MTEDLLFFVDVENFGAGSWFLYTLVKVSAKPHVKLRLCNFPGILVARMYYVSGPDQKDNKKNQ